MATFGTKAGQLKGVHVTGAPRVIKKLRQAKLSMERRVMRRAVTMALTPVMRAAKRNITEDEYRHVRKAIGKKVWAYRESGVIWGGVGPRKEHDMFVPKAQQPGLLIRILEFGTDKKPATRPLRRAMDSQRSAMRQIMERESKAGLAKEMAKLEAKKV